MDMSTIIRALRRAAPGDVPADPMAASVMSPNYVPETSRRQLGLGALRGVLDLTPVGVADAVQAGINNMQSPLGAALRAVVGKSALPGDVALGKLGLLGSGPGYDAGRYAANAAAPMTGLLGNQAGGALPKGYARNQSGAIVWHGSPYKFDRFDASKIGTGEGAQAYGHGLYLAELPDVAKGYKETLAYKAFDVGPESVARGIPLSAGARGEFIRQAQANLAPEVAARNLQNANISARSLPREKLADLFAAYQKEGGGQLYKVDLPDDAIARMLDWDRPFSQQAPQVRKALQDAEVVGRDDWLISGMRGSEAYKRASFGAPSKLPLNQADDQIYAAERLRRAGIPGIRYLDGGSRGAGSGTSNFVVFPGNEGLLNILERNGQPLR